MENKFVLFDLGQTDYEKALWTSFSTKEQAEAYAQNYNENQRSTRQRNFAVVAIEELDEFKSKHFNSTNS